MDDKSTIVDEFKSIATKLQAEFQRSRNLQHRGLKGAARESAIVHGFLSEHLPEKSSVGSGEIIDSFGYISRQQDIVIYDGHNIPVLQNFGETKVFFAEQVQAVIEVKSNLAHGEIKDVIGKASSVGMLRRPGTPTGARIPVFGFAYSSPMTLEQIRDYSQKQTFQVDKDWGISAIVILKDKNGQSGLITNVDSFNFGTINLYPKLTDPIASIATNSEGASLLAFYLLLLEAIKLTESFTLPPNYLDYANRGGLGTINVMVGKLGGSLLALQKALGNLRNAHNLESHEIITAWHTIISMALANDIPIVGESMCFSLAGRLVERPTPLELWKASNSYRLGQANVAEQELLRFLVSILQEAARQDSFVEIVPCA